MKFEDLQAWQKARQATNATYQLCKHKPLASDFSLRDQIQRAAVSVMNNIAEGFERAGNAEKLHFYNIARGSAGEVKSICYIILDNKLAPREAALHLQSLAAETSALIQGLIKSTRSRQIS